MLLAHAMGTLLAHVVQLLRQERERLFHGVRKKWDGAGGDEPAADAGFDEFRDSGDVGRYDGAFQGEGFHDDDREAFGKAGEDQGAGAEDFVPDGVGVKPAGNADMVLEVVTRNQTFDRFAHGTIADQGQVARNALLLETIDRFNEK